MIRQFRNIEKGEFLVAGYDMATGVKDYCAVVFISKQKVDVPLVIHTDKIAIEVTNTVVNVLERIYDITEVKPLIAPETNSGGVYEIERMLAMNRLNKYDIWKQPQDIGLAVEREPIRYGWTTTTANRSKMLSDLKQAIDNRVLRIYDEKIINEMYSFVLVKSSSVWKAQAENNAHDDLIMALAIAYQLFQSAEPPQSDLAIENMIHELPKDNLFTKDGFY
jgi:hypothetical protein